MGGVAKKSKGSKLKLGCEKIILQGHILSIDGDG
jgi:hypothetical protein